MMEKSSKLFKEANVEFLAKPVNQEQLLGAIKRAVKEA
jgi:FixJ family two-component response regulator